CWNPTIRRSRARQLARSQYDNPIPARREFDSDSPRLQAWYRLRDAEWGGAHGVVHKKRPNRFRERVGCCSTAKPTTIAEIACRNQNLKFCKIASRRSTRQLHMPIPFLSQLGYEVGRQLCHSAALLIHTAEEIFNG